MRKRALAPWFLKPAVARLEPTIEQEVDKLCNKLRTVEGPANLSDAFTAFSADVIGKYALGVQYGFLDDKNFSPKWRQISQWQSFASHPRRLIGNSE